MRIAALRKSGFTLVELLTVVSIMSVMIAAMVPAVKGLARSSARQGSASMLMGVLEQARALALSQGRSSYIVFADSNLPPDKCNRAACVFLDDANPAKAAVMQGKWIVLPTGYCFKNDAAPSVLNAPADPAPMSFILPGQSKSLALPYIKFGPTGAVLHPTTPKYARVFLLNGFTSDSGTQVATSAETDQITISRFTGRPKYLTGS